MLLFFAVLEVMEFIANVLFINIFDKILSFNVMGNAALTIVLECIAVFIICNIFY